MLQSADVSAAKVVALPAGWALAAMGDVTEPSVSQEGPIETDSFTYVDIGGIDNVTKQIVRTKVLPVHEAPSRARQRLQPGDVLVSTVRPNLNGVALVPESLRCSIGSTGFHVLRAVNVKPEYIYYLVQSRPFVEVMTRLVLGVLYPAVRPKDVTSYAFPFAPLPEQARIVAEIEKQFSRLDVGVAALKRVQANLKRYRASVLKAACEGRLVPQDPNDEPASELLKRIVNRSGTTLEGQTSGTGRLGRLAAGTRSKEADGLAGRVVSAIPSGWTMAKFGELVELANGINFTRDQKGVKGILTVDVLNMYGHGIYVALDKLYRVDVQVKDYRCLRDGDILFVRSSVKREGVGWASLFKQTAEPVAYCGFIIRARPFSREISPAFLITFFRTRSSRQALVCASSQVTITNINQSLLASFDIPLPPFPEQVRIVAEVERRLSVVDELEAVAEANLKRANRLRQAILKRAFEGKLVPQDPSDEPASVLLERIRAERSAEGDVRRRQRMTQRINGLGGHHTRNVNDERSDGVNG